MGMQKVLPIAYPYYFYIGYLWLQRAIIKITFKE